MNCIYMRRGSCDLYIELTTLLYSGLIYKGIGTKPLRRLKESFYL